MATIVRRKRKRAHKHPARDVLAERHSVLKRAEQAVARDLLGAAEAGTKLHESVVDDVIEACEHIARLGRKLTDVTYDEDTRTWTPTDLYERSMDNRRIMFLELVAWAIAEAERPVTRVAFGRFEAELKAARLANGWGPMPWPRAKDPERFAKHVESLANGFTVLNGGYLSRLPFD